MESPTASDLRTWGRSRAPRLSREAYAAGHPVHVTLATQNRRPLPPQWLERVVAVARRGPMTLGVCAMPDHLHWILGDSRDMTREVHRLKGVSQAAWRKSGRSSQLWQRSYYDRLLVQGEQVKAALAYLIHNPVEAGWVEDPRYWPYLWVRGWSVEEG